MATQFTSPVGRYVQGSPFKGVARTDDNGNPLLDKDGNPRLEYVLSVAFAKNDPHWPAFEAILKAEAAAAFPQFFPQGPTGPCTLPNFSFKIVDGDGVDNNGRPNPTKEGFAGHWVVRFKTGYAPQVYPAGKYQPHDRITDPNLLKCGYYVRVTGTVAGNGGGNAKRGGAQRYGIYVNMVGVEMVGFGEEIQQGPDVGAAFKAAGPAALPPGARPTPAAHGAVDAAAAPAPAPAAAPSTTTASPGSAAPYSGHMTPAAPAPAPAAPAPAPGPTMTPKANGIPYESYLASGWTDDMLRAQGYML